MEFTQARILPCQASPPPPNKTRLSDIEHIKTVLSNATNAAIKAASALPRGAARDAAWAAVTKAIEKEKAFAARSSFD